ncbi:MAG: dynamin family protein [Planctomycetes bacterium]|nr:dynamin family protein [Planctomycetota bacterium]
MEHAIAESRQRLDHLEEHLRRENPTLLEAVRGFRNLDRIVHEMGLLRPEDSFATQVPWYPIVSVLGTFSSGKSSFINHYLGSQLQRTGNQAVDDKFTVICFASDGQQRTLPGSALDADPRFPFFRISEEIEKVAPGEGRRSDRYLQLKTCASPTMRGRILIDSPGFDADAQRTSVLRLTDHIVHLSDLVLVFFDARHPEPGAMRDTLEHLVRAVRDRPDGDKFLYVLNQMDTAAREDNPEEVFAAWQRSLAAEGLTAGRFYAIFNPDCAVPIEDEQQRRRFEDKRDQDLGEIRERIQQVEISRAYRIVDSLEQTCLRIRDEAVPALQEALARWRRLVLALDAAMLAALAIVAIVLGARDGFGVWKDRFVQFPGTDFGLGTTGATVLKLAVLALVLWFVHTRFRLLATGIVRQRLQSKPEGGAAAVRLADAFLRSTRLRRPLFATRPTGWTRHNANSLRGVLGSTTGLIQDLNDRFAQPTGESPATAAAR